MHPCFNRRAVSAFAIALCMALPVAAQEAVFFGAMTLQADHPLFGGLSAIEMTGDGTTMVVLSDRGAVIWADLGRDETGRASSFDLQQVEELTGRSGTRGTWAARDSEGLAMSSTGTLFLSFEGDHRVARYLGAGETQALPPHPAFADLQPNASLEALAIDAQGRLYTLPERSGELTRPFPVYRFSGGTWDTDLSVPRKGRFLAVGADFDDAGRFYLLERDFSLLFGFATRIRRFHVAADGLRDEEILLITRHGRFSNLEGLSIWRDAQGRIVASMVSDDNFSPILSTQLVEFLLPD